MCYYFCRETRNDLKSEVVLLMVPAPIARLAAMGVETADPKVSDEFNYNNAYLRAANEFAHHFRNKLSE
ncbi:hypothetical protein M0804_003363 [Polistes exclamans]|nr:hypothetical protein M0804_003363 [Polistes exclamans]